MPLPSRLRPGASHLGLPPRLVITEVQPQVQCGQRPVKATVDEAIPVSARVFSDGRRALRARVRWRQLPARSSRPPWAASPFQDLAAGYDDWWSGSFQLRHRGAAEFRIEAWEDRFGSWRDDVLRRLDAGVQAGAELAEGWELVRGRMRRLGRERRAKVVEAIKALPTIPEEVQLTFLTGEELAAEMSQLVPDGGPTASPAIPVWVERPRALFGSWYELFPRSQGSDGKRSGTLTTTTEALPGLAEMGFDVVYLTPIHPIGHTGRRGANNSPKARPGDPGSPWAIGSADGGHTAIHPDLGTLEDFHRLLIRARELGLEVAMDYALQCSPDHPWVSQHPGWFARRPDGSIRPADNPPKRYDDIYPLDFGCRDWHRLWEACYQVLEFWIGQGVRIFRVDNPHTKPLPFWAFVLERLRRRHPDVILLAEAFTRPAMMRELAKLGFSQSYTYFTWRSRKEELTAYLQELCRDTVDYLRPNFFVNTPDILGAELQEGGPAAFRLRLVLAATLAPSYGIYSGFELCESEPLREGSEDYLNSEKYQLRRRKVDPSAGLGPLITRLNRTRRDHPALQQFRELRFHQADDPNLICYSKRSARGNDRILTVVNLDPFSAHDGWLHLDLPALGLAEGASFRAEDLLGGASYDWQGAHNYVRLEPERSPAHLLWVRP